MRLLHFLLLTTFAVASFSFTPVSNFSLSQLQGTWYVTTVYSTISNWSLTYCTTFTFKVVNSSYINSTVAYLSGLTNTFHNDTNPLYPDPQNPAIIYQDSKHKEPPFVVGSISTVASWQGNVSQLVLAINYTNYHQTYMVFGLSRSYDTPIDVRSYLLNYDVPLFEGTNFWGIDNACDTHYKWVPVQPFNHTSLLNKKWNILAVYDPANSTLVPWYSQGAYPWNEAYCAQMTFIAGPGKYFMQMHLSAFSIYQGGFTRYWNLLPNPSVNSVLYGFDISGPTLLYVQYWDLMGNAILSTGTTTSFLISTSNKQISPSLLTTFEKILGSIGWQVNDDYIYQFDNPKC